ncbi:hypothetical protein JW992_02700 [candidate division KSB1 bacterium]|nr:hypothetical protein [candidate division KSB1 bacterium]
MKASSSISSFKGRFLAKVSLFLALFMLVDYGLGSLVEVIYLNTPNGPNWSKEKWLLEEPYDIVVFGSSRALRHYVPKIIAEKTGRSVFNAGQNGQYLLYAYGLEQLLLDRLSPEIIVLDILPSFVVRLENSDIEFERLSRLAPFIDNREIRHLLTRGDFFEGLKYQSRLYRYNAKILSILKNTFSTPPQSDHGFDNLGDVRFHDRNPFIIDTIQNVEIDSFKVGILQKFVTSAQQKGVLVVACFSPVSEPLSPNTIKALDYYRDFFAQHNVPLLNFSGPEYEDREIYIDLIHMDEIGATKFSCQFAKKLRTLAQFQ